MGGRGCFAQVLREGFAQAAACVNRTLAKVAPFLLAAHITLLLGLPLMPWVCLKTLTGRAARGRAGMLFCSRTCCKVLCCLLMRCALGPPASLHNLAFEVGKPFSFIGFIKVNQYPCDLVPHFCSDWRVCSADLSCGPGTTVSALASPCVSHAKDLGLCQTGRESSSSSSRRRRRREENLPAHPGQGHCVPSLIGPAAMNALALFSHPIWFICSLALAVMLWAARRRNWSPDACPVDLSGKTAIVTGANSGIGKQVALDLARRNAHTILACRSKERGQAALEEIRRATGNPRVQLRILDTSSMASVRDFARRFLEEETQLDILVHNAGASGLPHAVTAEGLELLFATNVLGAFLLTNLLLDTMKASARIVNVSSFRHHYGKMNLKFLTGEVQPKIRDQAYNSTKLMNIVFTAELARRLQGTGVSVNALNPGIVKTQIMRHYSWWARLLFHVLGIFFKSERAGASSTLYCAVSEEVEGISGKYFDSDCSLALPLPLAQDPEVGRKLWDALEKLTGLGNGRK